VSVCEPAESYYVRWQQLNDWLVLHQPIWQPAPFIEPIPAWVERYPRLAHWVAELTDAECDDSPQLIQKGFPAFCQWAAGKNSFVCLKAPILIFGLPTACGATRRFAVMSSFGICSGGLWSSGWFWITRSFLKSRGIVCASATFAHGR